MLRRSFIQIPGIGQKKESHIWNQGILSWDEFLLNPDKTGFPSKRIKDISEYLNLCIYHLEKRNVRFFCDMMPKSELWRLYSEFKDNAVFLDIETTGLFPDSSEISIIGIFDGKISKTFIADENLYDFVDEIKKYDLIITYNGTLFDIPFLQSKFHNFIPPYHIDLRFLLKRLGYTGGLKYIEKRFNIYRRKEIACVDGFEAVRLWNNYKNGDDDSLKLLIEYNTADIVNLMSLMDEGFEMMKKKLIKSL